MYKKGILHSFSHTKPLKSSVHFSLGACLRLDRCQMLSDPT